MAGMNIIEVRQLHKTYKNLTAVEDVTFEVGEREIFGFLGPNGAGKSTTIKMLATLVRPTSGTAIIDGHDIVSQPNRVRQAIGLVFQETTLDERLTAAENLSFHGMLYNVEKRTLARRMAEVLEMVELSDRKDARVKTYSGGMKRRLEIARGLIHYPRVLFLDEPTVGLDPQTRNRIWTYIRELRDREKLTIFMTTHYMDEAEHCDRIAIIDHGRIVALDTPANLKKMVGGDLITLRTPFRKEVKRFVEEKFNLAVQEPGDYLLMEVAGGESFIPVLAGELGGRIHSISLHRPTLDDVFLKLTGRDIREESANGRGALRSHMRWRR
ncbi:MAG: ATP-binding cassette domain-containing protein [Peptococcaceae bacterium]|nr:ATP-binding cassette domain-containing protein [Peptococcaceae bacterium]